ncbi:MAG TPA: hypothetical protein DF774_15420 [Rheinheimera sp.]|nr:hypothetical protein [Rheinheimera sp.]
MSFSKNKKLRHFNLQHSPDVTTGHRPLCKSGRVLWLQCGLICAQTALLLDFKAPYHTAKRPEYQCRQAAI